jgi:c-di-GMP-binding flagellar brake protein YcgR
MDNEKYEISVSFGDLSYNEREALIKYIFNMQIQNLKKKSEETKIY